MIYRSSGSQSGSPKVKVVEMRVLVVDDDPVFRLMVAAAIREQGHEVELAEEGEKAWLSLLMGGFQVVLCDWSMPGLSGPELCMRMRARKTKDYVYFILITGHQGAEKLNQAMEAGVDDFLTKPIDMNALTVRLRVANRILDFHNQIGVLKGLLPICMYCKRIRNDTHFWENVEEFIRVQTGADFTHSLCPDCYGEKVQPEIDALRPGPPKK
jgi:phosphoserine phosphatase RsbU/P